MSDREKNLLTLLLMTALIAGIFLGYSKFYKPRFQDAKTSLTLAEQQIESAQSVLATADLILEEQAWLTSKEPAPTSQQSAQTELQSICAKLAKDANLIVKTETLLPPVQPENGFYHRARIDLLLTGLEPNFYRWISSLNDPAKFRSITFLRLGPQRDDDTQIEAKVTVEQWYVPETL